MASKEQTFTTFTRDQAAAYASNRGESYPQPIYDAIFDFHDDKPRDVLLDVGTGPGKVVFDLVPRFTMGLGCDSSAGMIEQANRDAARLGLASQTAFAVAGAETCGEAFPERQVDVVTVAMAAHWFDMAAFYASVAKVLRPGGTLAMWTCSSNFVHPSVPRHEELQKIMLDFELGTLGPYTLHGNALSRDAYENLLLPWDIPGAKGVFEEASFRRIDWDRHGAPSAPPLADGSPGPFMYDEETTIDAFASAVSSASMVIRWRAANPELAGTDQDAVNVMASRLKKIHGDAGMRMSPSTTMLLLRRI